MNNKIGDNMSKKNKAREFGPAVVAKQPDYRRIPSPNTTGTFPLVGQDAWLTKVGALIPKKPYWYLAGPMSGIAQFNFPEFDRLAAHLRGMGYVIASPSEFEHEQIRAKVMDEATTGHDHDEVGTPWHECLARDNVLVSHPSCIGVIVMPGWEKSRGALLETFVATRLGKPLLALAEGPFSLTEIDRDKHLAEFDDQADAKKAIAEALEDIRAYKKPTGPVPGGFISEPTVVPLQVKGVPINPSSPWPSPRGPRSKQSTIREASSNG